ncbi:unnamed protein product [Brassica napus]|uniref:(rape) hypothetical protein n=1 Tax=Brassica napus TaxID=3708 RepID=A0A816PRI5_BRANA|nr:unnamed protein product [Brassica napus]
MILTWLAGKSNKDNIYALQNSIDYLKQSLEYFKKEEKYYLEQAAKRLEEAKVKHRANNRAGGLYSYKMKVCYERADQRVRDFQISVHNGVRFSYFDFTGETKKGSDGKIAE